MAETKYQWTEDMREISGFGGNYEAACRAMVSAGLEWFEANPKADPKFHSYEGIVGIISEDNEDAKALTTALLAAANGDCTGAMHQFSISHVLKAHKVGWPEYVRMMREMKLAESK